MSLQVTQLSGFGVPGGLRVRTRASDVLTATSTGSTITVPAAAQVGNFAITFDLGASVGVPTDVNPTNWTQLLTANDGSTTRLHVSARIVVAGMAGSSITGINATDDQKGMLVFRGTSPFHSFTSPTWESEITGGNPTAQAPASGGQKCPLIVFGIAGEADDGPVSFSTASPAWDGTLSVNSGDMLIGWKIYNGGAKPHSIDMADFGNANALASGYVILS